MGSNGDNPFWIVKTISPHALKTVRYAFQVDRVCVWAVKEDATVGMDG